MLKNRLVEAECPHRHSERLDILSAICAFVESEARRSASRPTWAWILKQYLPVFPPREISSRIQRETKLIRPYALLAALEGRSLELAELELESPFFIPRDETDRRLFREDLEPLLPVFELSAALACGRGSDPSLVRRLEDVFAAVAQAEGRRFGSRIRLTESAAPELCRILVNAPDSLKPMLSTAIVAWIAKLSPTLTITSRIELCSVLSHAKGCAASTAKLAQSVFDDLENGRDNAAERAAQYIALARAVFATTPEEARIYFESGVNVAGRLGDENSGRLDALIRLARRSKAPEPQTAYRLARFAELSREYVYEDKHFNWEGVVEALISLCPVSAIAILSRWRDRRFGDAPWLLRLAVESLVQKEMLSPSVFVCLSPLDWWPRLSALKSLLAKENEVSLREAATRIAYRYAALESNDLDQLAEFQRMNPRLPFVDVLRRNCETDRSNQRRMELAPRQRRRRVDLPPVTTKRKRTNWQRVQRLCEVPTEGSIDAALAELSVGGERHQFVARVTQWLEPARLVSFVAAFSAHPSFSVFDARALVRQFASTSYVSLKSAIRSAIISACSREPSLARVDGRWAPLPLAELTAANIATAQDVAQAALAGYVARVDTLTAEDLFEVAGCLAALLDAKAAIGVLQFGLGLLDSVHRNDDGDGPWTKELSPSCSLPRAMAGYVWGGLASPIAADRWRWSHVVRVMTELRMSQEVLELLECIDWTPRAFIDGRFEFYIWHARQWLFIGLARGGTQAASTSRALLQTCQRFEGADHVVIRALAHQVAAAIGHPMKEAPIATTKYVHPFEDDRQPNSPTLSGFSIDIGPYWLAPLGRAFGLTENAITRRVGNAIATLFNTSASGRTEDSRHSKKFFRDGESYHSHGSLPEADDLLAYRAYHAMMHVAGTLSQTRAAGFAEPPESAENAYAHWLASHLPSGNGNWVSDLRDPSIDEPLQPPKNRDQWTTSANEADAVRAIVRAKRVVLWGSWTQSHNDSLRQTTNVRSALVSRTGARALLSALDSSAGYLVLPMAEQQYETRAQPPLSLIGWVDSENEHSHLEEHDPWAGRLGFPGTTPARQFAQSLSLTASSDLRRWTVGRGFLERVRWQKPVRIRGERDYEPGELLIANPSFLRSIAAVYREHLIVIGVEIRRDHGSTSFDHEESRRERFSRHYLLGIQNGKLTLEGLDGARPKIGRRT